MINWRKKILQLPLTGRGPDYLLVRCFIIGHHDQVTKAHLLDEADMLTWSWRRRQQAGKFWLLSIIYHISYIIFNIISIISIYINTHHLATWPVLRDDEDDDYHDNHNYHDYHDNHDFLSYIFSVSENTKTIHLIMMIWLFSFTISSYKIVSSPPQDPGGSKKILSKSGYDS